MSDLATAIDAVPEDHPGEPVRDARLPLLADLTDDQIRKLNYLVEEEGIARGCGSWWWE